MGPGHAPIPAKLVTQILSHKFIELSELIPENLEDTPSISHVNLTFRYSHEHFIQFPDERRLLGNTINFIS